MGNWSPVYLAAEKGFSLSVGAVCLSLFWFSLTAGRLAVSLATLRFDARVFYRVLPFFLFAGLFLLIRTPSESAVWGVYVLIGLGCSAFYPLSVSIAVGYEPAWREVISSVSLGALIAGVGLGSCVTGFLRQYGITNLEEIFYAAAGCAVIMGWFSFSLTRRKAVPAVPQAV
jgi:fucose permease